MSAAPTRTVRRAQAGTTEAAWVRYTLIGVALAFVLLFLVLPLAAVFTEALRKGFGAYLEGLREPDAWSAIQLTCCHRRTAELGVWRGCRLVHCQVRI